MVEAGNLPHVGSNDNLGAIQRFQNGLDWIVSTVG
jgi:hypothetical protein